MDPLDAIHGVLRRRRAGVRSGHGACIRRAPGVRLACVPLIQACCRHAWCQACVEFCPLGREGYVIG